MLRKKKRRMARPPKSVEQIKDLKRFSSQATKSFFPWQLSFFGSLYFANTNNYYSFFNWGRGLRCKQTRKSEKLVSTGTKFFNCLQTPKSIFLHTANRAQYSLLDWKFKPLGCSFNCDDHIRFHIGGWSRMWTYICLKKYTAVPKCWSD